MTKNANSPKDDTPKALASHLFTLVTTHAQELAKRVDNESTQFVGAQWTFRGDIGDVVGELFDFVPLVTHEVRAEATPHALACCQALVDFTVRLMTSKIVPVNLKMALCNKLFLPEMLFDRSGENYRHCEEPLQNFIDELAEFKAGLAKADLELWNASTFAGTADGQTATFRYLLERAKTQR